MTENILNQKVYSMLLTYIFLCIREKNGIPVGTRVLHGHCHQSEKLFYLP